MKTALEVKLAQSLSMTPQLQQAIKMLQLNLHDLKQEIQKAVESNPMLENSEPEAEIKIDKEKVLPSYSQNFSTNRFTSFSADIKQQSNEPYQKHTDETDLITHLQKQIYLSSLTQLELEIAFAIIDSINPEGYLECTLSELQVALKNQITCASEQDFARILKYIQTLDPLGVGARNLKECLSLQLHAQPIKTESKNIALEIVQYHLELLAKRDFNTLKSHLKVSDRNLSQALSLIWALNPKPGKLLDNSPEEYVIPEVFVKKHSGNWLVYLNETDMPRVRIKEDYIKLMKQIRSKSDVQFLKNSLGEAKWFIKSLENRHETLLKVASAIVEKQKDFLEQGEIAIKPLVLNDIAEVVGMHPSTVSRVTNTKYIMTPKGVFELKYFFSNNLSDTSSKAIRVLIKGIIAKEDPNKPFSDSKIQQVLDKQGINVARRTVAKYRESLNIASSLLRKQNLQDCTI